jgi:hypothetical protein
MMSGDFVRNKLVYNFCLFMTISYPLTEKGNALSAPMI